MDFVSYNDDAQPEIVLNTDFQDIIGVHEASITLSDEHGNISQYILIIEILSEIGTDTIPILNSLPYFDKKEWEDSIPIELIRNSEEVVYEFPVP